MKISKIDRKKYFDELGSGISTKVESKFTSYQNRLTEKQIKGIVFGMILITLISALVILFTTIRTKQKGENPFNKVNELSKKLGRDSTSLQNRTKCDVSDLIFLINAKSKYEDIAAENLTPDDSLKLLELNKKLDKMMKK